MTWTLFWLGLAALFVLIALLARSPRLLVPAIAATTATGAAYQDASAALQCVIYVVALAALLFAARWLPSFPRTR